MLLPATAGVALGHDAIPSCDGLANDYSLDAHAYLIGTPYLAVFPLTGGIDLPNSDIAVLVAPGTYYVVWSDGFSRGITTENKSGKSLNQNNSNPLVVGKCPLTIATVASPTSPGTVGAAMTVGDTATLSGAVAFASGSSVTFTLYSDSGCKTSTGVTGSHTIGAISNGKATASYSTSWTPLTAGTYTWGVIFAGDTYNNSINSGNTVCGGTNETVIVGQASPSIATKLSKSHGYVGDSIYDSALLTGATATATGSVTYTVYSDKTCSTKYADAGTVTVANGTVPNSKAIPFFGTATYYWQAAYSGDAKNSSAISTCTEETLVVDPTPTPTPFQSFAGETAYPSGTMTVEGATGTPVRVATPPVTSTDGSSPSGDSMPLFALLICLSFGGLGLLAVQAQRQSIRK